MRKFKKVLAFALAAAMILTAAPVAPAQAAAAPAMNYKTKTIYVNGSKTYNNVDLGVKNASTKTYSRKFTTTTAGKKVVSVDSKTGVVKAKKAGTATITATLTNKKTNKVYKKVTSKVTVKTATKTLKVSNKDIPARLNVGGTYDFDSSVDKGASTSRTWSSSDKSVATINSKDGVVTAVAGGKVTLTVKEKYSGKTAKVTLEVVADAPVATQTGVKNITITNGVSMDGKTITLKKDKTTITLDTKEGVTLDTDGKKAVIKTAGKLTSGTYTVTVGDKNIEVPVTDEKVSKILILSEKAAVKSQTITSEASAVYTVENQFGEDITKTTTVRISGSYVSEPASGNGKIVFENKNNFIINRDVVNVVVMHPETGVSASAALTISDAPVISDVKYEGIYNVDGKTLTEDSTVEDYYLLFTAKDQYGQQYKDYKNVEIGRDLYVTLNAGLTNLGISAKPTGTMAKKITKNGVDYLGVQLAKIGGDDVKLSAGTAQVYVIAQGLSSNITENVVVESGSKVTKLTVHAPGYVVAGEETVIDYTAVDGNGNEVTAYNSFKNIEINSGSIGKLEFKKDAETGKAKLVYKTNPNVNVDKDQTRTEMFTITIKSGTYQAVPVQLTVKENARPTEIIGTGDASTGTVLNGKISIALEKLEISDQYGRTIKADDLPTVLDGYSLVVEADANSSVFNYSGSATTALKITATTPKNTPIIVATSKGEADTEQVTVTVLDKAGKVISGSGKPVELTASAADKVTSIKVDVKKVYSEGGTDYKQKVEVTGTRNGAKITLNKDLYQVNVGGSDLKITPDDAAADAHYVEVTDTESIEAFKKDKNLTEVTQKIEVVLLSGETVSQDVVISNVKPQVAKVEFGKSGALTITSQAGAKDTASDIVNRSEIKITDTYDKEYKSNGTKGNEVEAFVKEYRIAYNFTFLNYTDDDTTTKVNFNGSNKAEIIAGPSFKTCTLSISFGTFKKEMGIEKQK